MGWVKGKLRYMSSEMVAFDCPGCGDRHAINVQTEDRKIGLPAWGFNGDAERPTFSPSILCRSGHFAPGHQGPDCWCNYERRTGEKAPFKCYICHSYVTDGKIQFLDDCTHHLRGRTVPLPDMQAT